MTSKSDVTSAAVFTVRMTMLAMVPLSLYAGKKTLRLSGKGVSPIAYASPELRVAPDHPPRRDGRFHQDRARQFRFAQAPLDERDRHLGNPAAAPRGDVQHFHEKRIAVGDETVERHRGQRLTPPAPIAARAIACTQSRHSTYIDV